MSISLQVYYQSKSSNSSKASSVYMNASRLQTLDELCLEVFAEVESNLPLSLDEYALYHPKSMVWLNPLKYVWEMSVIAPGCFLELRPKNRYIRIRFLDGASKTLLIDESLQVRDVTKSICQQLRLDEETHDAVSLVVAGDYAVDKSHPISPPPDSGAVSPSVMRRVRTSSFTGMKASPLLKVKSPKDKVKTNVSPAVSPRVRRKILKSPGNQEAGNRPRTQSLGSTSVGTLSSVMPRTHSKKQISKRYQIRLDTPWLDPDKTLGEQEVSEDDEVILMYRFYYHMDMTRDSKNVQLLYRQASVMYLTGELLCTEEEMTVLSALLCQVLKKDYDPKTHTMEYYLSLRNQVSPPKCKIKSLYKEISAHHASLQGMSSADAKCCFVKIWSTLPLFGMEFLSCVNHSSKEKGLISISKQKVQFFPYRGKKTFSRNFDDLMKYKHTDDLEQVSLTFKSDDSPGGDTIHLYVPDYSGVLFDSIKGHFHLSANVSELVKNKKYYQFDITFESQLPPFLRRGQEESGICIKPPDDLTYDEVYWANRLDNPMISDEELKDMQEGLWENPLFQNMDQLMDERFDFLENEDVSSDDEDSVFPAVPRVDRSTSFPMPSSPQMARPKLQVTPPFSCSPSTARTIEGDNHSSHNSPQFSRKLFGPGASPLLSRSISEGKTAGSSSPFTGSPIIFKKDFLKGSPLASPRLRPK